MRLFFSLLLPIFVVCEDPPVLFLCYQGDSRSTEEVVCPSSACVTRLLRREEQPGFALELDCNPEKTKCQNFMDQVQVSVCCVTSLCNNAYAVVLEAGMNITDAGEHLALEAEKQRLNREDRLPNPIHLRGESSEEEGNKTGQASPLRKPGKAATWPSPALATALVLFW